MLRGRFARALLPKTRVFTLRHTRSKVQHANVTVNNFTASHVRIPRSGGRLDPIDETGLITGPEVQSARHSDRTYTTMSDYRSILTVDVSMAKSTTQYPSDMDHRILFRQPEQLLLLIL